MNPRTHWFPALSAACCALLLFTVGTSHAQTGPLEDLSAFPKTTLTISGGGARTSSPSGWPTPAPGRSRA